MPLNTRSWGPTRIPENFRHGDECFATTRMHLVRPGPKTVCLGAPPLCFLAEVVWVETEEAPHVRTIEVLIDVFHRCA